jgi:tRNA dimethylallyltransferase
MSPTRLETVPEQPASGSPEALVVVVGPTASGKTALAVRLAEALGGEVVSADSVQIYRRFDVGAGKPTPDERRRAPHHLIDALEPLEPMDAALFAERADRLIAEIRGRGRVPIVCGGTYLWVRALLFGLARMPPADPATRERHRAVVESEGRARLHERLSEVDPAAAARLAPNDFVRVSRALEVYELTGTPQSEWHRRHGFAERRHAARLVGVRFRPEALLARIEARARSMLDAGWVEEVEALSAAGYREARAMRSVGYRQIAEALDEGAIEKERLLETIVRATKIFARRQRTWLRDEDVLWLDPAEAESFDVRAKLGPLQR